MNDKLRLVGFDDIFVFPLWREKLLGFYLWKVQKVQQMVAPLETRDWSGGWRREMLAILARVRKENNN